MQLSGKRALYVNQLSKVFSKRRNRLIENLSLMVIRCQALQRKNVNIALA